MSYPASLRQQAKWIREALDPATDFYQRITLDDVDTEELDAAADYIDGLVEALESARDHFEGTDAPLLTRINAALVGAHSA